jgi:peroxiredoxin
MTESSNRWIVALLALGLSLTVPGTAQSEHKLGDKAIVRIERFRHTHDRLPNSLAEIGMADDDASSIHYCITTDTDYIVFYSPVAGRINAYRSQTQKWNVEHGGFCIAPGSSQEREMLKALGDLETIPEDQRAEKTSELAVEIRRLPSSSCKVNLAAILARDSADGEYDRDAAQQATATFEQALREHPTTGSPGMDASFYGYLAELVRYEHMHATLHNAQFSAAMAKLASYDERRGEPSFTLPDLNGKIWRFRDLRGKVVVLNIFATWCAPCVAEMPDLEALFERYEGQGLIVIGITPDTADSELPDLQKFLADRNITYPILMDKGNKIQSEFGLETLGQSFVYSRDGSLIAQTPYLRTRKQFLEMLAQAGIK